MKLAEARGMLRRNLSGSESDWGEELLDGALNRAIDDLNRVLPLEKVSDFTLIFAVVDESWTSADDVSVTLANKRLKVGAETVQNTGKTITYVRDTDYTMDYIEGKITSISSGAIPNATGLLISYTKLQVYIDISSLTNLVRVVRAEYPGGDIPSSFHTFYTWGDFLVITSKGVESQQVLREKSHIWIYYHATHIVPEKDKESSWPPQLDEVVTKGAEAYSLLTKSLELKHAVRDRLVAAKTTLQEVDAIAVKITTALDKTSAEASSASADLADISTRLSEMVATLASVGTSLASAGSSITFAQVQAGRATSEISKIDTPLSDALSRITAVNALIARISSLATNAQGRAAFAIPLLVKADLDLGRHKLADVDSKLLNSSVFINASSAIFTASRGELAGVNTYLKTKVDNLIQLVSAAIISQDDPLQIALAQAGVLLTQGNPTINQVNIGEGTSEIYRRYGETYVGIARLRYDTWSVWTEQMDRQLAQGEGLIREASEFRQNAESILRISDTILGEINAILGQTTGFQNNASKYIDVAGKYVALGQVDAEAANAEVGNAGRTIEQANSHIAIGRLRLDAAQTTSNIVNSYIAAAAQHIGIATARIAEANARRTPIDAILERSSRKIEVARIFQQEADRRVQELALKQQEVDRELAIADREAELSDKFEEIGTKTKQEFAGILSDRAQIKADSSLSPTRQQAPGS